MSPAYQEGVPSGDAATTSPSSTAGRTGRASGAKPSATWPEVSPNTRFAFWDIVPLVLVILTLLGSVAVPARQTWRIMRLLRERTRVLAPARLLVEELQSGLAKELVALQRYALSGDAVLLARQRATAAEDDRRLAALAHLTLGLDAASAGRADVLRRRVDEWRQLDIAPLEQRGSRAEFAAALRAGQPRYDSSLDAIAALSSDLAAEAAARDDRVRALEHLSIASNAALVFAALVAMSGVLILTLRQRRLSAMLHRRATEEVALRQLARRLSAASNHDQALGCVADDTLAITRAQGAYVEWAIPGERVLACVAAEGGRMLTTCTRGPYAGSLTEATAARGGRVALTELDALDGHVAARLADVCGRCPGLVIPLHSADEPLGVLVLLRHPAAPLFGEDQRRQLRLVSDLASEALRRVDGMTAERAALKQARRRARQEAALRAAAEALAGAHTIDEVTQRIAHAALEAMPGRGAFVEQIVVSSDERSTAVSVRAVAGIDMPPRDATSPFAGSYTELVIATGKPMLIANLGLLEHAGTICTMRHADGSAVVVPLGGATSPVGALFVVSSARDHFRAGHLTRAGIFGHLAALAYERVRLLEEAHERRRVLERMVHSRSRLIRGFSHDVKNAIGAADGFADLLSLGVYGEVSAATQASIDRMRRSLRGALALIDDLHELGRAETGNVALSCEPLDLAELVRTLVEEYHEAAQRRGLSLAMSAEPDVPILDTDRARVWQIASNLLSNAIKYTEHGSVLVRARREPADPSNQESDWVLLEFTDSGAGIPADKLDYIFEEFSRLGGGETPGAGLGLAISKLLAQALGGDISVESALGHGSTFTLWLPLRAPTRTT